MRALNHGLDREATWYISPVVVRLRCLILLLSGCTGAPTEGDPPIETPEIHTPRWAFLPWISKDISDGPDTMDFVDGFESRDIPVGVVVIDSPWDVNYTTFRPNPARYPDFGDMVAQLRGRGIRTVMWCTQMLNADSFDLEEGGDEYDGAATTYLRADREEWLVNEGETYLWWKGKGAGIDFFDEPARQWWHGLQDNLLDMGIAGWKLDFGESYMETPTIETDAGVISHQEYSEEYYRDFWAYGVHKAGRDEFVTMVRAYDESYHFEGRFFARPEHAPVAWMGDNRRDFIGLEDALDHMFRSARAGYVVVGSDIGGYLDLDDADLRTRIPFDETNFHRWTAIAALTPFMQLHGRTNITPWTTARPEDTVRIYRYWSWLHTELVPFFYSLAEEAYAGADNLIRPIGDESEWPGDYRFQVGDAFLVAPILDATGIRDVVLPSGRWFDWFDPNGPPLEGTVRGYDATNEDRMPLFVREGAIVPMTVASDVTGLGDESTADAITVLVWPSDDATRFTLHDPSGTVDMTLEPERLTLSNAPRRVRVRAWTPAGTVWAEAPANDGETVVSW